MVIKRPEPKVKIPEDAELVHKGVIFDVYQWQQEMFDGSFATFERIRRKDTAIVLPVMNSKILMTQQEQPGVGKFIGAIGGRVDDGEDPLLAVKREMLEESGMDSDEWTLWRSVQLQEKIDWASYIFVARNCEKISESKQDAGERIKLVEYSFEGFLKLVKQENYRDIDVTLMVARAEAVPGELEKLRKLVEEN